MKGTLFSADFIEDNSGELRLLEINTDTSTANPELFDYTDFISILQANNIDRITVIHKPDLHQSMVNHLSSSLNTYAPFITSFTEIPERANIIYPTFVADEEGLFILRLAYDESSIFDSEYAKINLNLLSLFYENAESGSVVEFYHSSSLGYYNSITGQYNTSNTNLNAPNIPDAVVKPNSENQKIANFYKIGSEVANESSEDRWNGFINDVKTDTNIIQKYHINDSYLQNNRVSSIRTYSIIYGSNLDLIHLAQFKSFSVFDIPSENLEYFSSEYANIIDTKHYYEFATNIVKYEGYFDGILNTHLIIKADDTQIEAGSLEVGDMLKSYYIGSSSLYEGNFEYRSIQISGSSFPSDSYLTSSVVIYKNTRPLENKTLIQLNVNNNTDSIYVGPTKSFLVYDSIAGFIQWKSAITILNGTDYLLDYDGSLAQVTGNEILIINEDTFSLVEFDIEETDTFIIAGETPVNSFVAHNAPCFVAGTKIALEDGSYKNIEDVKPGDIVCSFDLNSNSITYNEVGGVFSKKVDTIIEYKLDNEEILKATSDHPIYVVEKGWASYNNDISNKLYSLEQNIQKIEVGDSIKLLNGFTKILDIKEILEETIVYNLQDIKNNNNYFANNILVHNRFFACFVEGTLITIENNNTKAIEDVKKGDSILTFNEKTEQVEVGIVGETYTHEVDEVVVFNFDELQNNIKCTKEHPIYVIGKGWTKAGEIEYGDVVKTLIGESKIVTINYEKGKFQVYNLLDVSHNHNFFANSILVHNKL